MASYGTIERSLAAIPDRLRDRFDFNVGMAVDGASAPSMCCAWFTNRCSHCARTIAFTRDAIPAAASRNEHSNVGCEHPNSVEERHAQRRVMRILL